MSDKMNYKRFFEVLDTKSALIVGVVGGLLSMGTIGFVVMGVLVLQNRIDLSGGNKTNVQKYNNSPVAASVPQSQDTAPSPVVPKSDRPKVELFVMSYCPYGLQMEKAYLPAWDLLKNKADIDLKFVSYAMHGKKEIDENTRQYCIQKNYQEKYISYLNCFTGEDNFGKCLSAVGLSDNKLASCVSAADKQFNISGNFDDQSKWLSGRYPIYAVNGDLNDKYSVQGSPTLVINGVQAEAGRTPEAVKQAICNAFNNPPAECKKQLANTPFQPGFGSNAQ